MAVTEESNLAKKVEEKQAQFGQLKVQKLLIQQQLDALESTEVQFESDYAGLQTKEQEIVKQLNEKYGPGNLDPQTGVFTPAPAPVETSETT